MLKAFATPPLLQCFQRIAPYVSEVCYRYPDPAFCKIADREVFAVSPLWCDHVIWTSQKPPYHI